MAATKRRYTTVDGKDDWIVSVSYEDKALNASHWFEASVSAKNEKTGAQFAFPRELATYRIGEVERPFRQLIALDWNGDTEAALRHHLDTIYRRVYSCIEYGK